MDREEIVKDMEAKKVPKPKPGKVIRIPKELKDMIEQERLVGESWGQTIKRLIEDKGSPYWALPSKVLKSYAEARGEAIAEAARLGKPIDDIEQPIKVLVNE